MPLFRVNSLKSQGVLKQWLPGLVFSSNGYHSKHGVYGYKYKQCPENVTSNLKLFSSPTVLENQTKNAALLRLINEFRSKGHFLAKVNPLYPCEGHENKTQLLSELINTYQNDNSTVNTTGLVNLGRSVSTVSEIVHFLKRSYCGAASVEFMHISSSVEREWFGQQWEEFTAIGEQLVSVGERKEMAKVMLISELFDHFVGAKLATVKRYGGEGAETMMAFFYQLLRDSCLKYQLSDVIIGMPHRGRLNLLAGLLGFPPVILFRKMSGMPELNLSQVDGATGDVLSHLFTSVDLSFNDSSIHVSLLPNPSHLEAVSPVVCGKARGKAMTKKVGPYSRESVLSPILPVQIHGDGAFAGQGVIMETLNMSRVPHFDVDGSIHLIVNNQIAFSTPGPERGRSSHYCSDVMKMIEGPVIHVNGDSPEAVAKATKLALAYRQTFGKDIAIDLICFRKWGHNEVDEPRFTNPLIYKKISSRPETLPQRYAKQMLDEEEMTSVTKRFTQHLSDQYQMIGSYVPENVNLKGVWTGIVHPSSDAITQWDTGVHPDVLRFIGIKAVDLPKNFKLHPTLQKVVVKDRISRLTEGTRIDWAIAESLAFGSLLYQDFNVRLSGQDVGRGTFSHRHVMLVDQESEEMTIPLNKLKPNQAGFIEVANSILSEEAGIAFEYGISIDSPNGLVIWEAQFGDFFNGAQIMFDTLISSGEFKWLLQSGLVVLLPHGYDGAGPEHSSCRVERFLQMCDSKEDAVDGDNVNWVVANPSTPAQYFHLLRRQLIRNFRKPLIVVAPKVLLRHPDCVSGLNEFSGGTYFKTLLPDVTNPLPKDVKKIIFCSGKHYYALHKERVEKGHKNVAIIRLEELCPFPAKEIGAQLETFSEASEFIWSQEEHQNMGFWSFINPRFANICNRKLKYVGRSVLGAPAVGIGLIHKKEAAEVISRPFEK